jgi:hypothetical protein
MFNVTIYSRKDKFKTFGTLGIPIHDDKGKPFSEGSWNSRPEDISTLKRHGIIYEARDLQTLVDSMLSADGVLDEDSVCSHCHAKVGFTSLHVM